MNASVLMVSCFFYAMLSGTLGSLIDCIDKPLRALMNSEEKKVPVFEYGSNGQMVLKSFTEHLKSENMYDPPPDFYFSVILSKFEYENLACLAMFYRTLARRVGIETCGDYSLDLIGSFAQLRLPIDVTEEFCLFTINSIEYCEKNEVKPIKELEESFATYSGKEIGGKINILKENFEIGSENKDEKDRQIDTMKRIAQACHKNEIEMEEYITFYGLVKCFESKIKEKAIKFSSEFKFTVEEDRKEFKTYFQAESDFTESVMKSKPKDSKDICSAFFDLDKKLMDTHIEACETDGLSFSNKKALLGHYLIVADKSLKCSSQRKTISSAALVISVLLTLLSTIRY